MPAPAAAPRDDRCRYHQHGHRCRRPPAGELRGHSYQDARLPYGGNDGVPWGMCDLHVQPQYHPPDLQDMLVRWG